VKDARILVVQIKRSLFHQINNRMIKLKERGFSFHLRLILYALASVCFAYTCFDDAFWAVTTSKSLFRQNEYDQFMTQCRLIDSTICKKEEFNRLWMNVNQPSSVYNFTETGFWKTRAPVEVRRLLQDVWDRYQGNETIEIQNTAAKAQPYHNHWDSECTIIDISRIGGPLLQAQVADAIRPLVEEWTGMKLAITSVYGIRIYHNQSILAPHVDRLPLVSSAIINVAQEVDEPWPLEIYDHNGVAHNISMDPWDLVLYESHSSIHGRPFPLRGRYFANVFVHFEPYMKLHSDQTTRDVDFLEEKNPPYLIPDSPSEMDWRLKYPKGWLLLQDVSLMAQKGDLPTLQFATSIDPALLRAGDAKGWQPIHEAARFGHVNIVKWLIEQGVNYNEPTKSAKLSTPLAIARRNLGADHPMVKFLLSHDEALKTNPQQHIEL
jgi:prolyl 4-hydroxylase